MIALQIFFAVFNFLLVAFLLVKFAGPKISSGLNEMNETNRRKIEAAEQAQTEASKELESYRSKLSNVDAEFKGIVDQAKTVAAQTARSLEATAQADAERLRSHAAQEIERERSIASQLIQRSLWQQALEAAKLEMRRQMNPDLQQQLVVRFIQQVGDGTCPINL